MQLSCQVVDEAIDASAAQFNLRDTIQDFQSQAEEAKNQAKKTECIEKGQSAVSMAYIREKADSIGIYHLRRYFHLLIFQAYLNDRDPEEESPYSFESFVKHRPGKLPWPPCLYLRPASIADGAVFRTLETELEEGGLAGLAPLDRLEVADGMAVSRSLQS